MNVILETTARERKQETCSTIVDSYTKLYLLFCLVFFIELGGEGEGFSFFAFSFSLSIFVDLPCMIHY